MGRQHPPTAAMSGRHPQHCHTPGQVRLCRRSGRAAAGKPRWRSLGWVAVGPSYRTPDQTRTWQCPATLRTCCGQGCWRTESGHHSGLDTAAASVEGVHHNIGRHAIAAGVEGVHHNISRHAIAAGVEGCTTILVDMQSSRVMHEAARTLSEYTPAELEI